MIESYSEFLEQLSAWGNKNPKAAALSGYISGRPETGQKVYDELKAGEFNRDSQMGAEIIVMLKQSLLAKSRGINNFIINLAGRFKERSLGSWNAPKPLPRQDRLEDTVREAIDPEYNALYERLYNQAYFDTSPRNMLLRALCVVINPNLPLGRDLASELAGERFSLESAIGLRLKGILYKHSRETVLVDGLLNLISNTYLTICRGQELSQPSEHMQTRPDESKFASILEG